MRRWILGLLPLLLLAALLALFFTQGPLGVFLAAFPPLEELTIERIVLPQPGMMVVHVVNGGPDPVSVAQVMVDDALWQFWSEPEGRTIARLGRMRIHIPYPWVEGEAHEVKLLTSSGLTFSSEVAVATRSPRMDWRHFWTFSLLGLYAGVIPVFLGLLWYPFLREVGRRWISFFLSLTVGLLAFLALDTLEEALEAAGAVAGAFQGVALVGIGVMSALLILVTLSQRQSRHGDRSSPRGRYWTASMVAFGIGLHNLGEGLAIGSSYATGEIALGTFLVVGFTLHNITEGLGIVTPVARDEVPAARLAWLGLIAGAPTIVGTWIGGFSYSAVWVTLFLAVGAGAILQVIWELGRIFAGHEEGLWTLHNLSGFLAGLAVMYLTGLLVVD